MQTDKTFILSSSFAPYEENKRIDALLQQSFLRKPRLNIERARYFTHSLRQSEGLAMTVRWAKAMVHVMENMEIHILPHETIVGRFGSQGRYGIFYPELEGSFFVLEKEDVAENLATQYFSEEDCRLIQQELLPYWRGRTYREGFTAELSPELKKLMYSEDDFSSPSLIVQETAYLRHSLQWVHDYEKILQRGFVGIEQDALYHVAELEEHESQKRDFYTSVIELCQGIKAFSLRYANHARYLASLEASAERQNELLAIAERCEHVPYYPARNFQEALQSQWFTQFISRIEQLHGGNISNGRIDQYLYPFFIKDIQSGAITLEGVKECLSHLWCNMSQILRLQTTPSGEKIYENNAHWEATTIGGQLSKGEDATNELSYLILETSLNFPLDYPYLCVRIHENTPEKLLKAVAHGVRQGKDVPVLMNDEEIISVLQHHGATEKEARNYTPSGYSEARLLNRNTYLTGSTWLNLVAVLEMALSGGRCSSSPKSRVGLKTGDATQFTSFDECMDAFFAQLDYVQQAIFSQQYIADKIRHKYFAFPFLSSLHSLCMKHGMEITSDHVPESLNFGGFTGVTGFATVVDSLAAIKSLIFEEKTLSMEELLKAVAMNFEGFEDIRQYCLHCPKFGTGDALTIGLAKEIDRRMVTACHATQNFYGGTPQIFYVPVTTHVAMGRISGATPNGRRAGEELSSGTSPTYGAATKGPLVFLSSEKATKNPELFSLGARVIDLAFCPRTLQGEKGIEMLCELIKGWCKEKHWYLRFHMQNQKDLALLKNNPERFKSFLLREPGVNGSRALISPAIIQHMFASHKEEITVQPLAQLTSETRIEGVHHAQ